MYTEHGYIIIIINQMNKRVPQKNYPHFVGIGLKMRAFMGHPVEKSLFTSGTSK